VVVGEGFGGLAVGGRGTYMCRPSHAEVEAAIIQLVLALFLLASAGAVCGCMGVFVLSFVMRQRGSGVGVWGGSCMRRALRRADAVSRHLLAREERGGGWAGVPVETTPRQRGARRRLP
jgi:hypothetical protein